MDFRAYIEDDSALSRFIRGFSSDTDLIKVTIPTDTSNYELTRLKQVADKLNFYNEHVHNSSVRYFIAIEEKESVNEPIKTRKESNGNKKTPDNN